MWKEIKRGRRRARRHLPRRRSSVDGRWMVGAALLAVVLAAVALVEGYRRDGNVESLVAYARERGVEPVRLIEAAGRANRFVFLGDVYRSRAPKLLAAEAIEALARGPGLDAVVLEVGIDQQSYIDAYLESDPENIAILYAHPRTLQRQWGVERAYLEIYRRVWKLNNELGPTRSIRVLAADLPGWPSEQRLPPPEAARLYATRDLHMAEVIEHEILDHDPWARVLIFMGGHHGLKHGTATLRIAGAEPVRVTWLATRLNERHPGEVFTILPDTPPVPAADNTVVAYAATRAFGLLQRNLDEAVGPLGLRVDDHFDFLAAPLFEVGMPGLELGLDLDRYDLRDLVDGYVFLGRMRR